MTTYQAIRGMNDTLPTDIHIWQHIESVLADCAQRYGYTEIRFPLIEPLSLFKRTIGEVTDIVEKEMYAFADRNGDILALRPEGTAGCVRAGIEHGLFYNQRQKLWYRGPMFRYERPQKGRLRQFHHFGLETYGFEEPEMEVELICLVNRLFQTLGVDSTVRLQLNSIGSLATRAGYREALITFYEQYQKELDPESIKRLYTNPLRLLDSKDPQLKLINPNAPVLTDYLDDAAQKHWTSLCQSLDALNICYEVNPHLVRGLDYYNDTVFEWVTTALGAQGTVCAGGRYDGLVGQLGGKATSAVGLAIGLERLVALVDHCAVPVTPSLPDVYVLALEETLTIPMMRLAEQLRDRCPDLRILVDFHGGSLKNQLKRADKSGAARVLILDQAAYEAGKIHLKAMKEDKPQALISLEEVSAYLSGSCLK